MARPGSELARRLPPDEPVGVVLNDDERRVLCRGLIEWGGPARCTEEMAVALGFDTVADLHGETDRLLAALVAGEPLTPVDWGRVLLSTEVVFASDLVGAGVDWECVTGLTDEETIRILRDLQRTLVGLAHTPGHRPGR